ncbi:MAG TPA: PQQ-dependent dehydrogenase, methanol/ethanol family [Terriglobales bacterium]|nr:PQQ-dependent dehydrogenase, methanol/ethanol family [Terriglobales bacterium]
MHTVELGVAAILIGWAGCSIVGGISAQSISPMQVTDAQIVHADEQPGNWLTYGRTYNEQRFSPLKEINDHNIKQLGLTWYFDLDTNRGQEATPLVADGVMYFTTAWSKVFALNAATGKLLWSYDPRVPKQWGVNACCDVVNRGVAIWQGKIYFGTLDGRLIALDAATGELIWEVLTIDRQWRYTITGAPRIVKGKVLIGNGGAEYGVRGYVSAYDAQSGKLVWRFYTVPGDPAKPFEQPILQQAAKTWSGEWWKIGGGGTVWDAIVYDPELDLVYIGVGNAGPWNEKFRNPKGGTNLLTCSIVALKPDTGEYVWHYQESASDDWDYDSAEQIILADLSINGKTRKVILHAPKNGIFYVLDRKNGGLISAKPFTFINWATGVDPKTGRAIETGTARYSRGNVPPVVPGPLGAHSWQPMSYSPLTGITYIPVNEVGFNFKSPDNFEFKNEALNFGIDMVAAEMPQDPKIKKAILDSVRGKLVAWDPIQQKQVWAVDRPGPWNGGTLATAGNLVFEGTAAGNFEAYRADTGEKLWSFDAQTGVMAGPVAYTVNGEQYVAVLAGWGGVFPMVTGDVSFKSGRVRNVSRLLAFKLDSKASLPPLPVEQQPALNPPPSTASAATIQHGNAVYERFCSGCHGDVAVSGGLVPDLRYSSFLASDEWFAIVRGGELQSEGMVSFAKEVSQEDGAAIRSYVIFRANQSLNEAKAAATNNEAKKPQ